MPNSLLQTSQHLQFEHTTCALCGVRRTEGESHFVFCSKCRIVIYCSRDHQIQHAKKHKNFCNDNVWNKENPWGMAAADTCPISSCICKKWYRADPLELFESGNIGLILQSELSSTPDNESPLSLTEPPTPTKTPSGSLNTPIPFLDESELEMVNILLQRSQSQGLREDQSCEHTSLMDTTSLLTTTVIPATIIAAATATTTPNATVSNTFVELSCKLGKEELPLFSDTGAPHSSVPIFPEIPPPARTLTLTESPKIEQNVDKTKDSASSAASAPQPFHSTSDHVPEQQTFKMDPNIKVEKVSEESEDASNSINRASSSETVSSLTLTTTSSSSSTMRSLADLRERWRQIRAEKGSKDSNVPEQATRDLINENSEGRERASSLSSTNEAIPFQHRNNVQHTQKPSIEFTKAWISQVWQQVIEDMNKYGVCVVDNLLGDTRGSSVLREVQSMYTKGEGWQDGQLVKSADGSSKSIRGDRITWVDGKEPHCRNVAILIKLLDNIVMGANHLKNNGLFGKYRIRERSKAMVACYPGCGTHYVKHVDNPNDDGRIVTAIYYLNKDWNTKEDGGLLRIFPEGWSHQVADIEPLFDRVIFFWSDRRNPHEVQPAHKTRYAITLWYFDANVKARKAEEKNIKAQEVMDNANTSS